jgi:hypothetical protein
LASDQRQVSRESSQRVSRESLGAWVLKCNPAKTDLASLMADGGRSIETWCVADNYRSELFEAGQPVFLWVSGSAGRTPTPGIWARGQVAGPARPRADGKLVVPVELRFLDSPLPRADLLPLAPLHDLEVLRQPQMSNPSFLTTDEYDVIAQLLASE